MLWVSTPYTRRTTPMTQAYAKLFEPATETFKALTKRMTDPEAIRAVFDVVTREVDTMGEELKRQLLQAHASIRDQQEVRVAVTDAEGLTRTRARRWPRTVMTRFGSIVVWRLLYQRDGRDACAPLDAQMGLPSESFTLDVREEVARQAVIGSYDQAVEMLKRCTSAKVAKRQAEELTARAASDFCEFYNTRGREKEDTCALLVLTFDGAGVRTRLESLRPVTRKLAEHKAGEPKRWPAKLAPGKKKSSKRMAQVAAVYSVAPHVRTVNDVCSTLWTPAENDDRPPTTRPRPINKRVWASAEREVPTVIAEAIDEALTRDPAQQRRWIVLIDGHEYQRECVERELKKRGISATIIVDLIHVLGYLWGAANRFHVKDGKEAQSWVIERARALMQGVSPSEVARGIRQSATKRKLSKRQAVDDCADYLINNGKWMSYREALELGFPIATGVIEGACKHLVKNRMDLGGAKWHLVGAEVVLCLRSLLLSGDWKEYWAFHEQQEMKRVHAARYAGEVPNPLPHLNKAA